MSSLSDNEQLEKVFLKLGLAETDDQLQSIVKKFLPHVLLKLASTDASIRAKVLELLTHLNKRLKSRREVQLPVYQLILQFDDVSLSNFVKNFTIIYIKTGFPRLAVSEKLELVPLLFFSLQNKSRAQQDVVVKLITETLPYINFNENGKDWKKKFDFQSHMDETSVLMDYALDVLLMPYSTSLSAAISDSSMSSSTSNNMDLSAPPGLSKNAVKRLVGDTDPWGLDEIEQVKISIINFIKSQLLDPNCFAAHLIVACSDSRHTVATNADLELRKHYSTINWDSPALVSKLYKLCLGHAVAKKNIPVADKRQPANIRMKLKLLLYMLRSKAATECFPQSIQLVYDGLFAASNSKLQVLTLQFVHHIFLKADLDKLKKQAVLLLDALIKITANEDVDSRTKSLAYVGIGKLSLRLPELFVQRVNLLLALFQTLSKEESVEIKTSIQEAIMAMAGAYIGLPSDKLREIDMLIENTIDDNNPWLRQASVQYAGTIFPSTHVQSRYLLLLAAGDTKEEVSSVAQRFIWGKSKHEVPDDEQFKRENILPSFANILKYVHEKASQRLASIKRHVIGSRSMAFSPETYKVVLQYLRKCLIGESEGNSGNVDEDVRVESVSVSIAKFIRCQVRNDQQEIVELLSIYVDLIIQFLRLVSDPDIVYYLLEIISACPPSVSLDKVLLCAKSSPQPDDYRERISWLKSLTMHTKENIREFAAELFAMVFHRSSKHDEYFKLIDDLVTASSSKKFEEKHGSLLTLGCVVGNWLKVAGNAIEVPTDIVSRAKVAIKTILEIVEKEKDQTLSASACFAIGEIARKVAFPLPDGVNEKSDTASGSDMDVDHQSSPKHDTDPDAALSKLRVQQSLAKLLSSKIAHKVRERAVTALGRLPVGDANYPHTKLVLESLLESAEIKDSELHFTVGHAMCSAALGQLSPERYSSWTGKLDDEQSTDDADVSQPDKSDDTEWLLSKILSEYVAHRIPNFRQASCIWLMTMLKTTEYAKRPSVSNHLMDLQNAFAALLSEPDDLTQDIASKGFGAVYELGSEEQKKVLVDQLVESLAGTSNSPASKVRIIGQDGNSMFQNAVQLGKAPDGSNLTTYKELCSLASDLNQPDLVYKFLHLANHHALWNTKKGAAFGFRGIAQAAQEQLKPHLPRIVPRLYRYTFDPQPSVRSAMTSIWNVVAPEPMKTVETYIATILADLTNNLTHKLWRTRQACCLALADLLRIGFKRVQDQASSSSSAAHDSARDLITQKLPELWATVFRVRDDVKETVRDAAKETVKALKKRTIRLFDKDGDVTADDTVISQVLDVLLKQGMANPMEEVRATSLTTLVDIGKVSGPLIKPCIPQMVIALLEALSGLESPMVNYLHNRSGHVTQDALDWARAEHSKSSPMMETAIRCIQHCDEEVLKKLAPALADLTKRGVGLTTKAGCAHLITSLVTQCGNDVTPYAGKFINALTAGLLDRSLAVRKVNSTAIGHIARVAKDATLSKSLTKMKQWYMERDEENAKHASASVVYAVGRHCPDALNRHTTLVLPLAFYGMHEDQANSGSKRNTNAENSSLTKGDDVNFALTSHEMWEAIWNEFTPGSETAVRLYLQEIIDLCSSALQSASWQSKAQAAAAMSSLAKRQRPGLIDRPNLDNLLQALLTGLQGRTWEGKERLLEAIRNVCVHCADQMSEAENDQVVTLLFKECKREKVTYSTEAATSLAAVLQAMNLDKFEVYWTIVRPHLLKDAGQSDSDDDEASGRSTSERKAASLKRQEKLLKALPLAWKPTSKDSKLRLYDDLCSTLATFVSLSTYAMQLATLECTSTVLASVKRDPSQDSDSHALNGLDVLVQPLCACLTNMKFTNIREAALITCEHLVEIMEVGDYARTPDTVDVLLTSLRESPLGADKSEQRDRVRNLEGKLKSWQQNC